MKVSKKMAEALLTTGQYRTKKYLYELGPNMYGQETVRRTAIDSNGRRIGHVYSAGLLTPATTRTNKKKAPEPQERGSGAYYIAL